MAHGLLALAVEPVHLLAERLELVLEVLARLAQLRRALALDLSAEDVLDSVGRVLCAGFTPDVVRNESKSAKVSSCCKLAELVTT